MHPSSAAFTPERRVETALHIPSGYMLNSTMEVVSPHPEKLVVDGKIKIPSKENLIKILKEMRIGFDIEKLESSLYRFMAYYFIGIFHKYKISIPEDRRVRATTWVAYASTTLSYKYETNILDTDLQNGLPVDLLKVFRNGFTYQSKTKRDLNSVILFIESPSLDNLPGKFGD